MSVNAYGCETCPSPVAKVYAFAAGTLRIRLCEECVTRWTNTWKLPKSLRAVAA